MIPRLWVCTDQPLVLGLLALPLHVLVILALVIGWGTLRLTERRRFAWRLARLIKVLFVVTVGLTLGFGVLGLLLGLVINPSGFLGLAPWAWGIAGPVALVVGVKRARREAMTVELGSEASEGRLAVLTVGAVLVFGLIAGRYAISDGDDPALSIPYRLLEWAVVDELGPVTDECLANRVLEYSRDDAIGRHAIGALARRGPSAISGIRARFAELRETWPPPDYTIKASGIEQLLRELARLGDATTPTEWEAFDWRAKFSHPKAEQTALPL